MSTFGELLKAKRKEAGFTQQKLAELSRVGRIQINHYENGRSKPSADKLRDLCIALKVSTEYFNDRILANKEAPGALELESQLRIWLLKGPSPLDRLHVSMLLDVLTLKCEVETGS